MAAAAFHFLFSLLCGGALLVLASCAAPGEPTPPRPKVPEAIADLAAQQSGDAVVLTFTLPKRTVDGQSLTAPPEVEIYRDLVPAVASLHPPEAPKTLVYTIPSGVVGSYTAEERVRFVDLLKPEELAKFADSQAVYSVRTRGPKHRDSADSNVVALRVVPVPEPIRDVSTQVTQAAIKLSWVPPKKNSAGGALPALAGYHVYRAEVAAGTEAAVAGNPSKAKLQAPLTLVGEAASPAYRDARFEFGRTYIYSVRSVAQYDSGAVESGDSRLVVVTPRDTFPPAPPQGLVVVAVPATAQAPAHLELSWAISPEPDVAGYNVYRSEPEGGPGQRLNHELLPTPVFRDMWAMPGRRYTYTVSAVDRAGNESPPSAASPSTVPGEGERAKP